MRNKYIAKVLSAVLGAALLVGTLAGCGVGAGGIPEWNKDRAVRLTWLGDMPWIE